MICAAKNPLSRFTSGLAAATAAIVLALAAAPADQASAAGSYTISTINNCPPERPYYKSSYTGYSTCSRYP